MKKTSALLLAVSLAANAALGAWLLLKPAVPLSPASSHLHITKSVAAPTSVDPLTQPLDAQTWPRLAQLSDTDYVARLRAEGFPPALVRDMLRSRITARYADRLNALRPLEKDEYWKRTPLHPDAHLSPEARKERRALGREISAEMKAALGDGPESVPDYERAQRERTYGSIPADKIAQIEAISTDYGELSTNIRDRSRGVTLPEDREQLRLLERERRADLEASLAPYELLQYDLRNSASSHAVRSQLTYFDATEEEFRALTLVRLDFDRQFGSNYLSEEEQAKKRTAEAQLLEQARTVLSPERYKEYALVSTNDFRNTVRDLSRFNFDVTVAKDVFSVRQNITNRAAAITANTLYSPEQRTAELTALYREASTSLTTKLGAKAYESYEREGAGNWIRKLKPAPTPPSRGGNE
ncbi:hypothetical protein [Oleiharenicola lentus]|uniref:hypothetical protein n=1 Tax=Oleiharenicola lentus TaxID=2508720 RepID=UPI003F673DDC